MSLVPGPYGVLLALHHPMGAPDTTEYWFCSAQRIPLKLYKFVDGFDSVARFCAALLEKDVDGTISRIANEAKPIFEDELGRPLSGEEDAGEFWEHSCAQAQELAIRGFTPGMEDPKPFECKRGLMWKRVEAGRWLHGVLPSREGCNI